MAKRNTFTKIGGSTYPCDICKRLTRHTGAQGLGSRLCPQCWDLAGLENEVSDGMETWATLKPQAQELLVTIRAKGGSLDQWAMLIKELDAA